MFWYERYQSEKVAPRVFRGHGLWLDELREPVSAAQWAGERPGAGQVPVYLAGRCLKVRLPADEPVSSPRRAAGAAG
jgi:hypothetical protein